MKKKFGIIGSPINHSLSPVLHKYWFKKYNIDADYVIIEAKDKDMDNNTKPGDMDKSNKSAMKKKGYSKPGEDENRSLLKYEAPNDSMAASNLNKSKFLKF